MTPLALLKKRYLSHTNRVRYTPRLEGQRVDNDGVIFVGNRAGGLHVSNLAHELSHFVEIDDARMQIYGWGLRRPEIWVFDRMCCEPTTMKMIERELRVIAYQFNLLESLGSPTQARGFVSSLRFMPDFLYVPLEDGRAAYGDDADEMDSRAKDESRIRWMARRVEELRSTHTLERFDSEWTRKINLLSA